MKGEDNMKWNCTGVKESIEEIKKFIATSKRSDKDFIAWKALKELDRDINVLLADSDNDCSHLLSYRRQVRQLLLQFK